MASNAGHLRCIPFGKAELKNDMSIRIETLHGIYNSVVNHRALLASFFDHVRCVILSKGVFAKPGEKACGEPACVVRMKGRPIAVNYPGKRPQTVCVRQKVRRSRRIGVQRGDGECE